MAVITDFWQSLDPTAKVQLITGLLQSAGGLAGGIAQGRQAQQQQQLAYGGQLGGLADMSRQFRMDEQSAKQFLQSLLQQQGNQDIQRQLALREEQMGRERTGLEAAGPNPLAWQALRQRMALSRAILPELRNVKIQAPTDYARFVPQVSGGFRIPEGGFGPNVMQQFSPETLAAAEGDYWRAAAPFTGPPNLSDFYGATGGVEPTQEAQQARTDFLGRQQSETASMDAASKARLDALMQALSGTSALGQPTPEFQQYADYVRQQGQQVQQQQQKKRGGFWRKLASIGSMALPFIPGFGALALPLRLGLGAGLGAVGGGLTGAAVGAAGAGLFGPGRPPILNENLRIPGMPGGTGFVPGKVTLPPYQF